MATMLNVRKMTPDEEALVAFAVAFWWVIGGPGSASWRAGFGLAITEFPHRFLLIPRNGR